MGLLSWLFRRKADGAAAAAEAKRQADEMVKQAIAILKQNRVHTDESLTLLKRAAAICPRHQLALKELGIAYQGRRAFAEAAEYLRRAANCATERWDCDSAEDFRVAILDRAATCYMELGKHADAVELWEYVLHKVNTAPDVSWSANAKFKLERDLAAVKARLEGKSVMRKYGPKGQGAAGIDRVLNHDETVELEAAILRNAARADLVRLVQSWRFAAEDAANLVDDAVAVANMLRSARVSFDKHLKSQYARRFKERPAAWGLGDGAPGPRGGSRRRRRVPWVGRGRCCRRHLACRSLPSKPQRPL
jgi:tetratricopeptide (TPR) repeat protein